MDNVYEKVCDERHKAIDSKMESIVGDVQMHTESIGKIEDAVIILTSVVESIEKRDIFDKLLIVTVLIISIVLLSIILGPEIVGKLLGNMS